jgi:hypothetical protein
VRRTLCEHGNEVPGSIKCYEIVDWLSNYQLLKKDCAAWSERENDEIDAQEAKDRRPTA